MQLFDVDTSDFTVTTAWQHDQYPTSFDGFLQQQGLSYWSIFINPLIPKQCQSLAADVSSAYSAAAPLYSEYEEAFAKSIVDIADLPVSVGKSVFEINELEATGIVTVGSFTLDIAKGELSACKDYLLDGTQQACLHSAAPHLANLQSELNKYLASKGDIKLSQLLGTVGELIGLINDLDELNTDIAGVPKAQAAFESQFPKYVTAYNKFATCIGVTPSKPAPPYISYPLAGAGSVDPNDKRGIKGAGPEGYVSALTPFSYSVFFENESSATAPARSVSIVDQLDNTLKPESVVLGSIALAGQVLTPTSIRLVDAPFNGTIDLRPTTNMIVKITASIDPSARLLKWSFQSLDPITNEPPTDPLAGFLPPGAEGSVFFTVLPQSTVRTGTAVSNTAAVIFDANPPINTPTWLNTIDNTPPISKVSALSDVETTTSFPVHWSASDSGAGVQDFMIYVAIDGGPFTAWQANTTATDAAYTGTSGHSYSFYSIARDLVGNIEDAKTSAEAVTTIIADSTPPVIVPQIVGTLGSNGWYRSNVSVSWLVNDPESGVAFSNGCAPVTLTAETAGMTLTCSATNGSGLSTSIPITLKIDETPPLISGMPTVGCSIWPPNGKFVQVGDVRANDRLSGFALGSLKVTGLSSELADDTHNGPVLITPDGAGGFIVQVQADRSGTGNGRIYMVNATVMDNAGNTATASATCTVPHDQGKH